MTKNEVTRKVWRRTFLLESFVSEFELSAEPRVGHAGLLYTGRHDVPEHPPEILHRIAAWWQNLGFRTKIVFYEGIDDGAPKGWRLYIGNIKQDCQVVYRPTLLNLGDEALLRSLTGLGHVCLSVTPTDMERLGQHPNLRSQGSWLVRTAHQSIILTEPHTGATVEFDAYDPSYHNGN